MSSLVGVIPVANLKDKGVGWCQVTIMKESVKLIYHIFGMCIFPPEVMEKSKSGPKARNVIPRSGK